MIEKLQRQATIYYLLTRGRRTTYYEIEDYFHEHKDIIISTATITRDIKFFRDEFEGKVTSSRMGIMLESDLKFIQQVELLI